MEIVGLFYDLLQNCFIDEGGYRIWNVYEYVTPNDIFLFKHFKGYMQVRHRTIPDVVCELFYPELDEDDPDSVYVY